MALAVLIASYRFGGILGGAHHRLLDEGVAIGGAVLFLAGAVIAVRAATEDLLGRVPRRVGDARISALTYTDADPTNPDAAICPCRRCVVGYPNCATSTGGRSRISSLLRSR